jgi:hypothetical protein
LTQHLIDLSFALHGGPPFLIIFESQRSSTPPGRLARARGRLQLSRSRDDGEGRKGPPGAAKRQHWPEFAVDGPAPSVTSRHFHDNLIGSDFRKLIL